MMREGLGPCLRTRRSALMEAHSGQMSRTGGEQQLFDKTGDVSDGATTQKIELDQYNWMVAAARLIMGCQNL